MIVRSPARGARPRKPNRDAIRWTAIARFARRQRARRGTCAVSAARWGSFGRAGERLERTEAARDRAIVLAAALCRRDIVQERRANACHADAAQLARRKRWRQGTVLPVAVLPRYELVINAAIVRHVNRVAEHGVRRMHVRPRRILGSSGFVMRSASGHDRKQVGRQQDHAKDGGQESAKCSHEVLHWFMEAVALGPRSGACHEADTEARMRV